MNTPCPFCSLPPETISLQDDTTLVFRDAYPMSPGHTLVIPRVHVANFFDLPFEVQTKLWDQVRTVRGLLAEKFHPDGFNIGMNFGQVAGAGVLDHYHLHVVPRWSGDSNFMTVTARTRLVPEELDVTFDKLEPHFKKVRKDFAGS